VNFSKAKEAIWKLERSRDSDWYNWWFGDSNPHRYNIKGDKKRNRVPWISKRLVKKIFGGILAGSIASYAIALVVSYYMNINNNKVRDNSSYSIRYWNICCDITLTRLKRAQIFRGRAKHSSPFR
jgi:hypothetical protein